MESRQNRNSKILGMFARTERSQMVLNDNHEQKVAIIIFCRN